LMGVTLGYPSGHPDPHSSMIMSAVESQSTAGSAAITTSTVSADISDTSSLSVLIVRQPPIGIATAAATNPTIVRSIALLFLEYAICNVVTKRAPDVPCV